MTSRRSIALSGTPITPNHEDYSQYGVGKLVEDLNTLLSITDVVQPLAYYLVKAVEDFANGSIVTSSFCDLIESCRFNISTNPTWRPFVETFATQFRRGFRNGTFILHNIRPTQPGHKPAAQNEILTLAAGFDVTRGFPPTPRTPVFSPVSPRAHSPIFSTPVVRSYENYDPRPPVYRPTSPAQSTVQETYIRIDGENRQIVHPVYAPTSPNEGSADLGPAAKRRKLFGRSYGRVDENYDKVLTWSAIKFCSDFYDLDDETENPMQWQLV